MSNQKKILEIVIKISSISIFLLISGCYSTFRENPSIQPTITPTPEFMNHGKVFLIPDGQISSNETFESLDVNDFYIFGKYAKEGVFLTDEIDTCDEIANQEDEKEHVGYYINYDIQDELVCNGTRWYHITGYQMDSWIQESKLSHEIASPFGYKFYLSPECNIGFSNGFSNCLSKHLWKESQTPINIKINNQSVDFTILDYLFSYTRANQDDAFEESFLLQITIKNNDDSELVFYPSDVIEIKTNSPTMVDSGDDCSRLLLLKNEKTKIQPSEVSNIILEWKPKCYGKFNEVLLAVNSHIDDEGFISMENNSLFFQIPNE